jgi:hypothetical protein
MNKLKWFIGSTMLGAILVFGFVNIAVSADKAFNKPESTANKVYQEECGACHLAYPASFLPEKSWNKIMSGLDDHFGESAELDMQTNQVLTSYLAKHSMRKDIFNRMLRNFPSGAPTRITELPYFIRKHNEIPERMVKNNSEVGSFSQCDKCHRGAATGNFEEDDVSIPGFNGWEN